jgi:hypothetical protein
MIPPARLKEYTPTAERRNHPPALARRLRCVRRSLYGFPAANPDRTRPFSAVEVQLVPAKVRPQRPTCRAEHCVLAYPRPNNFAIQANGPRLGGGALVGLLGIAVLRCVPRHLGHGVRWSRGSFIHSAGNTVPQLPHAMPDGRASVMRAPLVAERAIVHTHVRSPVRQSARNRGRCSHPPPVRTGCEVRGFHAPVRRRAAVPRTYVEFTAADRRGR